MYYSLASFRENQGIFQMFPKPNNKNVMPFYTINKFIEKKSYN